MMIFFWVVSKSLSNPSNIKSVTGGYSLGRFKRSEDHPKHKLIRDIAAIIAAIIGAGYAIQQLRGERVEKMKEAKSKSVAKEAGPIYDKKNEDKRLKDIKEKWRFVFKNEFFSTLYIK